MRTQIRSLRVLALAAVFCALGTSPARAVPAIEFSAPTLDFTNGSWSLGFEFDVLEPIYVTALGFYDDQGNGLSESHAVGIYDDAQNLLVSGNVMPGGALIGHFRYSNIAPVLLPAGMNYRIAGVTGSENYTWGPLGFVESAFIDFIRDRFVAGNTLAYPFQSDGVNGYFGANFLLEPVQVPEPATLLLVGIAALSAAARARVGRNRRFQQRR